MSEARARTLISVDDLASRLGAGSKIVLLHVRDEDTGKPIEGGVIPSAIDVYLASDFSGAPTKEGGKRPLPEISALTSAVGTKRNMRPTWTREAAWMAGCGCGVTTTGRLAAQTRIATTQNSTKPSPPMCRNCCATALAPRFSIM